MFVEQRGGEVKYQVRIKRIAVLEDDVTLRQYLVGILTYLKC
jgi:hypothetical protein